MKRSVNLLFGFVLLVGAYALAYFMVTNTSGDDVLECVSIAKAVQAKHQIPPSVSTPGRPAIFCDKGVRLPFLNSYDMVILYGVTNRIEQDAIVVTLENCRHESHITRNILLRFIDKENWITWSNSGTGNSGGHRGSELATREVWIR